MPGNPKQQQLFDIEFALRRAFGDVTGLCLYQGVPNLTDEQVSRLNAQLQWLAGFRGWCSVCGEKAYNTPSGTVCKNGHGGAPLVIAAPGKNGYEEGFPEELVTLISDTSMCSDQTGDDLVAKVMDKLWGHDAWYLQHPDQLTDEEHAIRERYLAPLSMGEAYTLISKVLKQVGHY